MQCIENQIIYITENLTYVGKVQIRALGEHKPPPTTKFQPKVIWDSNPDFRINLDPDVCRICRIMLWMHYLVGVSHFAKYLWYKLAIDCIFFFSYACHLP